MTLPLRHALQATDTRLRFERDALEEPAGSGSSDSWRWLDGEVAALGRSSRCISVRLQLVDQIDLELMWNSVDEETF